MVFMWAVLPAQPVVVGVSQDAGIDLVQQAGECGTTS
jgi:hypothetical protein